MRSAEATFRSEHDRNGDKSIFLPSPAPEPALSREWCVGGGVVVGLVEVKCPLCLRGVQCKTETQARKGALCDKAKSDSSASAEMSTFTVHGEIDSDTSSAVSSPMPCVSDCNITQAQGARKTTPRSCPKLL